jgi:hypothetical protein
MRIDTAGLVSGACAVLIAASVTVTACLLHRQALVYAAGPQDTPFALSPQPAATALVYHQPAPGWLHVPPQSSQAKDSPPRRLTSQAAATSIRWWMPQP